MVLSSKAHMVTVEFLKDGYAASGNAVMFDEIFNITFFEQAPLTFKSLTSMDPIQPFKGEEGTYGPLSKTIGFEPAPFEYLGSPIYF